eukprot:PhF_6_TR42096/c0_g1_i1/m.63538
MSLSVSRSRARSSLGPVTDEEFDAENAIDVLEELKNENCTNEELKAHLEAQTLELEIEITALEKQIQSLQTSSSDCCNIGETQHHQRVVHSMHDILFHQHRGVETDGEVVVSPGDYCVPSPVPHHTQLSPIPVPLTFATEHKKMKDDDDGEEVNFASPLAPSVLLCRTVNSLPSAELLRMMNDEDDSDSGRAPYRNVDLLVEMATVLRPTKFNMIVQRCGCGRSKNKAVLTAFNSSMLTIRRVLCDYVLSHSKKLLPPGTLWPLTYADLLKKMKPSAGREMA